jgi:hypothetical protein
MQLTASHLRALLIYDPDTGIFTRRVDAGKRFKAGMVAGGLGARGYIYIGIEGKRYLASRLAFLYMTGSWPKIQADHENTIRSDNRWSNLRDATVAQNAANARTHRDNFSGFKGVTFHKLSGLWNARIMVRGTSISLGYFKTPKEANAAYARKATEQHGKFARSA